MVSLFYATYTSVDIAHYEIFHANVGKGGIKGVLLEHLAMLLTSTLAINC